MAQISFRNEIQFLINGNFHSVQGEKALMPLAQYLRLEANLPGTKIVCSEGDCGACTVLVSRWKTKDWLPFQSINSCIAPVYLFDLASLVTVEGLQNETELNPAQDMMRIHHGGQCGYCTPGMVCSLTALAEKCLSQNKEITEKRARNQLTGNLCRCTGYEPILQSALQIDLKKWQPLQQRYHPSESKIKFAEIAEQSVEIHSSHKQVHLPANLDQALQIKSTQTDLRLVAGSTDLGVLHNKGKLFVDRAMSLHKIPELSVIEKKGNGLWVGAQVSLTTFEEFCSQEIPELSRLLRVFASPQIKNQGTLTGNILNGSPIGDSIPALLILDAEIHLQSTRGVRKVPLNKLYQGYKQLDLQKDEIALGLLIPSLPAGNWRTKLYKVSVRKDLDISAVTFAAALQIEAGKIQQARIALGGVGPTVQRLPEIETALLGHDFQEDLFLQAGHQAAHLIQPISDLRASEKYRRQVVENLFHKFYTEVSSEGALCP